MQTFTPSTVSAEALAAFRAASQSIVDRVVARSLAHRDDVVQHGEAAGPLITSGIRFTTQMLEAAMAVGEVALLEDQLAWALDRLPHGVSPEHVLKRFRIYGEVVQELLPAQYAAEILPFVDWLIARQQAVMPQESLPHP
jgi:hypothetical protein